jgi:diacylglycerol kinase (ATP)
MPAGKNNHLPRGPAGVWRALKWSLQGIGICWCTEESFRLEIYLLVLFVPAAIWLGHGGIEHAILLGCLLPVPAAELLNSAVEALIERYGAEHHEMAGRAKDMGSAAVFLLMMNVLLCWGLVLVPHWLAR